MDGRHICARRVAIWLSPRPPGPTLPTGTELKASALLLSPRADTRGSYISVELPDSNFGSVNPKVGKFHYFANLGVSASDKNRYAKDGIFHQHVFKPRKVLDPHFYKTRQISD
jgi:hypothetical protein